MKRLACAIAIAVLLFSLNFAAEKKLIDSCKEINSTLEHTATQLKAENYSEALRLADTLKKSWQNNITLFSIVSGDDLLLGPGKDIPAIHSSVADKNYANALMLIRECQGYLDEIIESHTLNPGNIL